MIISAKLIHKPRIKRQCDSCFQDIEGEVLRLYGAADYGDKPYVIHVHPYPTKEQPCFKMDRNDPKILCALAACVADRVTEVRT